MKRFFKWAKDHVVEILVVIVFGAAFIAALAGNSTGFSATCREAGGTPVFDGRQMACIK
jgi:hypothetical protein